MNPLKSIKLIASLLIPCLIFCGVVCRAEENKKFLTLKEFLDSGFEEYEVVFSLLHHSNNAIEQEFAEFKKAIGGNVSLVLDRTCFFRVRRTKSGFAIHRAYSLKDIEEGNISRAGLSAEGVVSNSYWSANNDLVAFDDIKFRDANQRLGANWSASSCEQAEKILALGIRARRGSFVWDNTNFIAASRNPRSAPMKPMGQSVSGYVGLSNGVPSFIDYKIGESRFVVILEYDDSKPSWLWRVPNQLTVIDELPKGKGSNIFSWKLIDLKVTNYPAASTGPNEFLSTTLRASVITKSVDGLVRTTDLHGNPLNQSIDIKTNVQENSKQRRFGRASVLAVMLVFSMVFVGLMFWQRKLF